MSFRAASSTLGCAAATLVFFAACSPAEFTLDSTDAMGDSAASTDSSSEASATKDATSDDSATDARGDTTVPPSDSPPADVACKCRDGCCPGVPAVECLCGAGDACPLKHDNGWGDIYWYCGPLGTPGTASSYNKDMALKAAKSHGPGGSISDSSMCAAAIRSDYYMGALPVCALWLYEGPLAGYAQDLGGGGCMCPSASSTPTHKWN